MRAAIVTAPGRIEIVTVPSPEPAAGQVRIRLQGCGVCASNLGPWSGPPWMQFPTEAGGLGHEGWGRIDAIGPDVAGFAIGDRVASLGARAFAEQDIAAADTVLQLPPLLSDRAFPGEAVACALNIFERSGIEPGQTIAIVGIGFIGALLTRLAHDAGACVIAISRRATALRTATEAGAGETIALSDHDGIVARVRSLTDGRFCERVIEATGKQWPLDLAAELCAVRGRLVIAGYHQDGPRQVNMQLWNWRGLDVVNAHERDPAIVMRGMRRAMDLTVAGKLDPASLLTHRFELEDLGAALDATRDRPEGFVKAWIRLA